MEMMIKKNARIPIENAGSTLTNLTYEKAIKLYVDKCTVKGLYKNIPESWYFYP